jgi:hypothetical protein
VFGFTVWRGQLCVWANQRFERRFFSAAAAQLATRRLRVMPELLFTT